MTKKVLLVGDPHLKIGAFKEAGGFVDKLFKIIQDGQYDQVIILGDLFDTFAVIRSEILALWASFLSKASQHSEIVLIVGNHDMAGESGGAHALEPFKSFKNVVVVDWPHTTGGMIHYLPFYRDNEAFIKECQALPQGSILFCHQSFNGAQFDNGFYDPHGVDPSAVSHLAAVISGHIHKNQKLGNIWYPGTPFQMNFSDAGENKGVFEIALDNSGYSVLNRLDIDISQYFVIEAPTVLELIDAAKQIIDMNMDLSKSHLKMIATGGPSEIDQFWKNESVKELKSKAKRVVDALVSVKPEAILPGASAKSKRERLHDFIKSRKWRTSADKLIDAAEGLLTK
jgi:DNA repair exonuclease SbcCD nuclease subunit